MVTLLAKWFIRNKDSLTEGQLRHKYGILCGALGVFLNIVLFAFKFFAGTLSGSIAITADAFNNLSDAGSSVVTLLGFKLANQKPDKEHPFGHGRMEYLSGLLVSVLIIYMGIELGKSSFSKILQPEEVVFSVVAVVILVASIGVKMYMGFYNRSVGKKINSAAMVATAADCFSDCLSTVAVLCATLVARFANIYIDGYVGLVVAVLIFVAGFRAAKETLSPLLGQAPEREFVDEIEGIVMAYEDIVGIHDLVVHDYGPGRRMISLHAEVPSHKDIMMLHDMVDNAEMELREKLNCEAVIHMDPIVTNDGITGETKARVALLVSAIDPEFTIHDFRMVAGPTHTNVIFDVVVPHGCKLSASEVEERVKKSVRALDGNYFAVVKVESSYIA
ncbi:MAG: cation transporter [Oscillospiraceae bacterium]|nr:cation transporter [Oscillospiraceae bacterium]